MRATAPHGMSKFLRGDSEEVNRQFISQYILKKHAIVLIEGGGRLVLVLVVLARRLL